MYLRRTTTTTTTMLLLSLLRFATTTARGQARAATVATAPTTTATTSREPCASSSASASSPAAAFLFASRRSSFCAATASKSFSSSSSPSRREAAKVERGIIDHDDDVSYFPIYYNDVYEVDMPPGHRFPMGKYRKVREALQAKVGRLSQEERRRVRCEFRVSPLATKEELLTTHDAEYVRRYLSGEMTERENRNIGFPWSLQHVNRTLSSVGGTVAAARAAWEEHSSRCERGNGETAVRLCWAAHVAGGTHHAFRDYGEGFCIFSDIAVAANVMLETYSPRSISSSSSSKHDSQNQQQGRQQQQQITNNNRRPSIRRILIIDLDVHQGNGNAALFDGDARVQTFSMHCSANYFSRKERSDLDVELPPGCDDATYLSTLGHWLGQIEQHSFEDDVDDDEKDGLNGDDDERYDGRKQFDLIFYQSGVDIHQRDRLGRLSVTSAGISRRNALVFDFAARMESPLVVCMGGGYPDGDDWTPIIEAHANVYWEAHRFLSGNGSS